MFSLVLQLQLEVIIIVILINTNIIIILIILLLVVNGAEKRPMYAGRKPSAATATGLGARAHNAEQV